MVGVRGSGTGLLLLSDPSGAPWAGLPQVDLSVLRCFNLCTGHVVGCLMSLQGFTAQQPYSCCDVTQVIDQAGQQLAAKQPNNQCGR